MVQNVSGLNLVLVLPCQVSKVFQIHESFEGVGRSAARPHGQLIFGDLDETLHTLVHQISNEGRINLKLLDWVAGTLQNRTEMMIFTPVVVIQRNKTNKHLTSCNFLLDLWCERPTSSLL